MSAPREPNDDIPMPDPPEDMSRWEPVYEPYELSNTPDTSPQKPILDPRNHSEIAKKLMEEKFRTQDGISLVRQEGEWFEYNGCCYKEKSDESIRAVQRKYLDGAMKSVKQGKNTSLVPFHPSLKDMSGILDALKSAALREAVRSPLWIKGHEDDDPRDFVSMKNGILHIPTRKLYPHTVNFFTMNSLPYDYEENGEPEAWLEFIRQIFPEDRDSQETLQEIFGYLLTPDTSQQKAFLIKGPRRSGKGTIGRVLKGLLGEENICGPSFSSIAGQFGLQPLIGKLAAIIPDARLSARTDKQVIVERLLSISGEDNQSVDRKHMESWNGILPTRLIILTNQTPQLGDDAGAVASRFIVLAMSRSFLGEEDHGLTNRLLQELPHIFRWALDGRDRLHANGRFVQPASATDVVKSLEHLNSPMSSFVADRCEIESSYSVEKDVLYAEYKEWCADNGIKHPDTKARFCENLLNAFHGDIKPARPRLEDGRKQVFLGIRIR